MLDILVKLSDIKHSDENVGHLDIVMFVKLSFLYKHHNYFLFIKSLLHVLVLRGSVVS